MVTVKFLGEEYEVSETINEFLTYDTIFTHMRTEILNSIMADIKKDAYTVLNADTIMDHIHNTTIKYRKIIENNTEVLVKKLLELGVYDVTASELLEDGTAIANINILEKNTLYTLLEEAKKLLNMQKAGIESAYNYAARNITGSGVRVFTSSFTTLMISVAVEKNIVMSQAKKADKEYAEAVKSINANTSNALDKLEHQILIEEFYPAMMQYLQDFCSEIMSKFLTELTNHGKFDFESVKNYNMKKADEMLKNIEQISDKIGFLKQAFLICPFSEDVYDSCLQQEVLDKNTFETAKYFGMGDALAEKIEMNIKENLDNLESVTPLISILASYRETDEIGIWKSIYEKELTNVADEYKTLNVALSNNRELDKFVRKNISASTKEIVEKSEENIIQCINQKIESIISEKQYNELSDKKIISPEMLRMTRSLETEWKEINNELEKALYDCVMKYIDEAKRRFNAYNKALDIYEKELEKKNNELSTLQAQKDKLGLLAFSKKKEMTSLIDEKVAEIIEFKKEQDPVELLEEFEKMYR